MKRKYHRKSKTNRRTHAMCCNHCGMQFAAAHPKAKYCDVACRNAHYRAQVAAERARHEANLARRLASIEEEARQTAPRGKPRGESQ